MRTWGSVGSPVTSRARSLSVRAPTPPALDIAGQALGNLENAPSHHGTRAAHVFGGMLVLTAEYGMCAEETQTLETKIASRAELVVCGMATIPEAVKVFAPNVSVEVKTLDGTLVPKGA